MPKQNHIRRYCLILLLSLSLSEKSAYGSEDKITHWYVPNHFKLQFAGSIGFLSPGIGYAFFKDRAEIELFGGYVPKSIGGISVTSMSLKLNGKFFTLRPWEKIMVRPLVVGLVLNYTFGKQFYLFLPNKYPDGYFWWPSALRLRPAIGGVMEKEVDRSYFGIQRIGIYYEISTADLYLVSLFHNSQYLHIYPDMLSLGLGIKCSFK